MYEMSWRLGEHLKATLGQVRNIVGRLFFYVRVGLQPSVDKAENVVVCVVHESRLW